MATVTDENGNEVEVQQVLAVANVATTGGFNSEFPPEAGRLIQEAMAGAIRNALADGITDPDEQRALALKARESIKLILRRQDDTI